MTKYTVNIRGNARSLVQGDGQTVVIHDGEIVTMAPRPLTRRLVKCKKCGELVPDVNYCDQCGARLK